VQFLAEKEEKRQLEAKIAGMQSQLLIGGTKLEDVPAFRALLAKVGRPVLCHRVTAVADLHECGKGGLLCQGPCHVSCPPGYGMPA
jgi:hypothetical protein